MSSLSPPWSRSSTSKTANSANADNYRGNTPNIGKKSTRKELLAKVYLHYTSFQHPANRFATLKGQVPESALAKLPMLDANGGPCLVVFKNGASTGTGRVNNVSSFTRSYFDGQFEESRGWPVFSTDK